MKILTICSGLDFINYPRRATIEAIHKLNSDLEILMFNSILNIRKKKNISTKIKFHFYNFWIVEKFRKFGLLVNTEISLRSNRWRKFFNGYEIIFMIDPNQYFLLNYISDKHKLIYLLRDPSVLQDQSNYFREFPIIRRANAILGISENLCSYYFLKYYGFIPDHVYLWPNTVDMELWGYNYLGKFKTKNKRPVIGMAGNINYVIDIELLIYITSQLPEYNFEIAGKLNLGNKEQILWDKLLSHENVKYIGFVQYNKFPGVVINWDIGLVAAKPEQEYAKYLNNNKQYQYIALGKPFVSYRFNADYKVFEDLVFLAADHADFVTKIKMAIKKSHEKSTVRKGIKIANSQSSEKRANEFLKIATQL